MQRIDEGRRVLLANATLGDDILYAQAQLASLAHLPLMIERTVIGVEHGSPPYKSDMRIQTYAVIRTRDLGSPIIQVNSTE